MNDEVPSTIGEGGKRIWVYPVEISGKGTRIRRLIAVLLILFFFALPWLTWGGEPLIRLSFLSGHFILLGQPILIYDFYNFGLLFVLLAITLFLSAALFGRLWCGYACPQTIFIEHVFRTIETLVEGKALQRKRQDAGPLTGLLLFKKTVKHLLFLLVCVAFAANLIAIFTGPEAFWAFDSKGMIVVFVIIAGGSYFDGAWFREQFCNIICPYARFQSVMQDPDTSQIGYDESRGEPRSRKKADPMAGDCIDCGLCVRVCPTGIDIRKGVNQQECISCTKCQDACDSVMLQTGRAPGLIRFDVERRFKEGPKAQKARFLRPRILFLSALWMAIAVIGTVKFVNRESFHIQVVNVSQSAYVRDGGFVKNVFAIKIGNQSSRVESYEISLLTAEGVVKIESPTLVHEVPSGGEKSLPVLVSMPETAEGVRELTFVVREQQGGSRKKFTRVFLRPQ